MLARKRIKLSKHFRNTWMRKWDWDTHDVRVAIEEAYKIKKAGKKKREAYARYHEGSRKLIYVENDDEIYIITGAEGR